MQNASGSEKKDDAAASGCCAVCGASAATFARTEGEGNDFFSVHSVAADDERMLVCVQCGTIQHEAVQLTRFATSADFAGSKRLVSNDVVFESASATRSLRLLRRSLENVCKLLNWSALEDEAFDLFCRFCRLHPSQHRFGPDRGFLRLCAALLICGRLSGKSVSISDFCLPLAVDKWRFGAELKLVCRVLSIGSSSSSTRPLPLAAAHKHSLDLFADLLEHAATGFSRFQQSFALHKTALKSKTFRLLELLCKSVSFIHRANIIVHLAALFFIVIEGFVECDPGFSLPERAETNRLSHTTSVAPDFPASSTNSTKKRNSFPKVTFAENLCDQLKVSSETFSRSQKRLREALLSTVRHLPWIERVSPGQIHRHLDDVLRFGETHDFAEDAESVSALHPSTPPVENAAVDDDAEFDLFIDRFILISDPNERALRKATLELKGGKNRQNKK